MNKLLDSNILIYYFNGLVKDEEIDVLLKESFNISIITKIEFLSRSKLNMDAELEQRAREFVSYANLFDLDDRVAEKTIEIRRKFKTKTPDAIIAATALVHNMSVVTNNTSDFIQLELDVTEVNVEL